MKKLRCFLGLHRWRRCFDSYFMNYFKECRDCEHLYVMELKGNLEWCQIIPFVSGKEKEKK